MFQSTPPRGGRLARSPWHRRPVVSFNPRPRAGGDPHRRRDGVTGRSWVSIHAPARGATARMPIAVRGPTASVSIHAPARGATPGDEPSLTATVFQSTPPRGGRHSRLPRCRRRLRVSFNPRPRAGGDSTWRDASPVVASDGFFNPRPRAGGDRSHYARALDSRLAWFQSTPPRGGRPPRGARPAVPRRVSIHAPARGATRAVAAPPSGVQFQSTPPRGGRPSRRRCRRFNPRPRAGGDTMGTASRCRGFNPRPRAGGDFDVAAVAARRCFNPRPRAGGDAQEEREPDAA